MISTEDEVSLTKRIKDGDQVALDKLVKANLRFVVSVAKQYHRSGMMTLGDLISEGNVGLIRAAKKFDETRGFKFISYAVWWIRQSIMEGLSKRSRMIRLPSNMINCKVRSSHVTSKFEQEYQREPTDEELAEIMGITTHLIKDANRWGNKLSLDASFNLDDSHSLLDVIPDRNSMVPIDSLLNDSLKIEVSRLLSKLGQRESEILKLTYGLCEREIKDPSEIAAIFGISKERVRQIKEKALAFLQNWNMETLLENGN